MRLIICDLDGTLSDCSPRQHLAAAKDWDGFHQLMSEDKCDLFVLELLHSVSIVNGTSNGREIGIAFLTGRPEAYREQTMAWLEQACDLYEYDDYIDLIMRPRDDYTTDFLLKQQLFAQQMAGGRIGEWFRENVGLDPTDVEVQKQNVLFLDDRDKVVAAWRDAGFKCWQVGEGAF